MTTIPPNPEKALVTISTPARDTVRVRDRVESSRFEFYFDEDVEIEPTPTDGFFFPVGIAANIPSTTGLQAPISTGVIVHDHATGDVVLQNVSNSGETRVPEGVYEVEIMSLPLKVYLLVRSEFTIDRQDGSVRLELESASSVQIGVRSHHEQPAGTIKTPTDIESLMTAVSYFGSALKSTTAERSWPTLRGYPPKLEIAPELSVPDTIKRPDVDVTLRIPRSMEALVKSAPLTYYLGAAIEPISQSGEPPGVHAAGTRIPLTGDLTDACAQLLKKNLILDCVVRSAGLYSFRIQEQEPIASLIPGSIEEVYNLSLGERIARYHEVQDAALERFLPEWVLTIDVDATASVIPALPHLAEELAVIRVPKEVSNTPEPSPEFIEEFTRADGGANVAIPRRGETEAFNANIASPEPWDTQMHVSLLDHYPLGSNKTTTTAYERHIEREAPDTERIEVHVVCNDDEMRDEEIVTELYGVRDLLEFDVKFHQNLSKEELKRELSRSFDLLHYIGHVDKEGILCTDGHLDVRTDVENVGVDAFLLNACTSVEQGEALLEVGAYGGIATLFDIPNSSATKLGRTLSRLLNRGFTIRGALEIARETSVLGRRWVSLGDGRIALTQSESGIPFVMDIIPNTSGEFDIEIEWFETKSHRIGSLAAPNTSWGEYEVLPMATTASVSESELEEIFTLEVVPIRCGGDLYWTDEITPSELRELY